MVKKKELSHLKWKETKGSIVRFELFEKGRKNPTVFWTVHHEHNRKKVIWSKEDYRKAAVRLNCTLDEFIEVLDSL